MYRYDVHKISLTLLKPPDLLIPKLGLISVLVWVIVMDITAKLFQRLDLSICSPFDQRKAVKFLHLTGCHFVFEVSLDNSLSTFVEKLFDIPYLELASCIPFLKPVFYGCAPFVFWPPAFRINSIGCKDVLNASVTLCQPHLKPRLYHFLVFLQR